MIRYTFVSAKSDTQAGDGLRNSCISRISFDHKVSKIWNFIAHSANLSYTS